MTAADTIQKPEPEPTIFDDNFELPSWLKWTLVGGGVIVIGGIAFSLFRR